MQPSWTQGDINRDSERGSEEMNGGKRELRSSGRGSSTKDGEAEEGSSSRELGSRSCFLVVRACSTSDEVEVEGGSGEDEVARGVD